MNKIKKGDIVARKSHGKDILFVVKNILYTKKEKIAILKGLVDRIEADSNIKDLEIELDSNGHYQLIIPKESQVKLISRSIDNIDLGEI